MRALKVAMVFIAPLLAGHSLAQSGAVIPQGGAGHARVTSCVILKRMGPADEVTSRLYSFGIRGKQFQYVEGKLPEGFPFHGRLTDHDVRNLQGRGAEVIVLESHYTEQDLQDARANCAGGQPSSTTAQKTGATASTTAGQSAAAKPASPTPQPAAPAANPNATPAPPTTVAVKSTPDGADISVDGKYVGSTPSTLKLPPGDHVIAVAKTGFQPWQRTITLSAGADITVDATLTKAQ